MSNRERRKGRDGEAEVRAVWEAHGFTVRGLEGEGDHYVSRQGEYNLDSHAFDRLVLHSEVKRCETARPWAWAAQAEREAPPGAVPVVSFRRNGSKWYALLPLDDLARLLA